MSKIILVVDDDRMSLELSKRKLEEQGYQVMTAEDGRAALDCLNLKKPELIILDVQMPDMDGYTFIIEKAKVPDFKEIPVVMLTGSAETGPLFKRHGVKGYLLKPLKLQELLDKVSEIIGPGNA